MSEGKKVHLVSLGCPKNRVDSEVMLGHLASRGYEAVPDPAQADVVVVNTCAFIDAAKEESVDVICEMAEHKKRAGGSSKLVVAGCLSQRYAPQLATQIPEVDHFLGTAHVEQIADLLHPGTPTNVRKTLPILNQASAEAPGRSHPRLHGKNPLIPFQHQAPDTGANTVALPAPDFALTATSPRLVSSPFYSCYVKVSEGCSNTCAFCVIPKLRGPQRSRPIADVVREVEEHLLRGVVELNLIAQDLCAYGKELAPRQSLAQLLRALDKTAAAAGRPVWIRCLYAYPRGLTREVIDVLGSASHIVPYLDMPLQHINDAMLRRMKRGKGGDATSDLVRRLRAAVPHLALRTTFITGLPGESDADFAELCDFVREIRFEHLGVFPYSREDDTPAAAMAQQVPRAVAEERQRVLMEIQRDIVAAQQRARVGHQIDVLVEGVAQETDLLLQGRHAGQAPEIDGLTYINDGIASPGDVVRVSVDQATGYDLVGGIVAHLHRAPALDTVW